jgi:hypothetical protein
MMRAGTWQRFWFEPEETSTLALVRIVFGIATFVWTITLTHDAFAFFSERGILPVQPGYHETGDRLLWGLLGPFSGDTAIVLLFVALLVASACLVLGLYSRLAALVVFIGLVSLERRNPFVFNSGDALLRIIALYVALAPSGVSFSLDRWRRAKQTFWVFPARAPWPLRMMQIQLSVLYLATAWAKLRGTTWNDGTAVSYALRLEDIGRFTLPVSIADSELLMNFLTYGTLAIELSLGILVWNRVLRPWVLACGVALHLGIDLTLRVGFFGYAILILYVAFIPPETASSKLLAVRERLHRLQLLRRRRPAVHADTTYEHAAGS